MDPARIPPLLPSHPAQSHPTVAAVQDDSSVTGSFLADSEEDPTVPRPHSARKEAVEDWGDVRRGGAWGQRYEGGAARGGGLGRDGGSGVVLDKLSLALSSASLGVVSEPNTDTGTASQASSSPSAMSSTRPPTHTSDSPLQPPRDNPRVYFQHSHSEPGPVIPGSRSAGAPSFDGRAEGAGVSGISSTRFRLDPVPMASSTTLDPSPLLIPSPPHLKPRPPFAHRKTHSGSFNASPGIHKRSNSASLRISMRPLSSVTTNGADPAAPHDSRAEDHSSAWTVDGNRGEGIVRRGSLKRNGSGSGGHHHSGLSRSSSGRNKTGGVVKTIAGDGVVKRKAAAIDAGKLVERLVEESDRTSLGASGGYRPLLVVDVRPLSAFLGETGRIKNSVNVNFPSLLIKRFKKGNSANFSLNAFITTEGGKAIFQAVTLHSKKPGTLEGIDVVVVDQKVETRDVHSTSPGSVLLAVLERRDESGAIYYLDRPFNSFAVEPLASPFIVEGEEEDDVPDEEVGTSKGDGSGKASGLLALQSTTNHDQLPRFNRDPGPLSPYHSASPTTPSTSPRTPGGTMRPRPPKLKRIDTSDDVLAGVSKAHSSPPRTLRLDPPTGSATKRHPAAMSIQALCAVQARSPTVPRFKHTSDHDPRPFSSSPAPDSPSGSSDSTPFILSTIMPGFLYLGPEPTQPEDFDELERAGIKEVLNLAVECDDSTGEIARRFEKYWKIPMRDFVAETGVQQNIEKACRILSDAQLQSKPVYVHCRAGKSRSVTIVIAYLVHRNHWPLKRAYAHVSDRRKGISPNISFVAELMLWEERERGGKSNGVFGSTPALPSTSPSPESTSQRSPIRSRDSMPPTPMNAALEGERGMEVRGSDGAWIGLRRDPQDLVSGSGRRASRAGLESAPTTSWD